mmetsp:Transcript_12755/g.28147  ORF Transcript_12755/g.28147 Transcript_12755/m.28147 type:complete len:227 (-) Transcript_12755:207-887(-)
MEDVNKDFLNLKLHLCYVPPFSIEPFFALISFGTPDALSGAPALSHDEVKFRGEPTGMRRAFDFEVPRPSDLPNLHPRGQIHARRMHHLLPRHDGLLLFRYDVEGGPPLGLGVHRQGHLLPRGQLYLGGVGGPQRHGLDVAAGDGGGGSFGEKEVVGGGGGAAVVGGDLVGADQFAEALFPFFAVGNDVDLISRTYVQECFYERPTGGEISRCVDDEHFVHGLGKT